jgi:hypothetical protein
MLSTPQWILLVVAFALNSVTVYLPAQEFARGVVFLDANHNQKLDTGEKPLSGIKVSNGVQIVLTDADGKYSLPVADDTILFVIKPSGYRTPLSKDNLPRFYYIHKPGGSPKLKFKGVEQTGPLPKSIDFPLYRQKEPDTFKAIMFGDPQPSSQKEIDYIAHDVVEELVGTDAALGVTLGDILFDDLSLFPSNNRTIALMGIPWYNVIGNHDINLDAKNRTDVNQTFEKTFGPTYYSFDYGSTHFLVLDDIDWIVVNDQKKMGYRGGFGEAQLEFIKNDLARIPKDQFVCLMMHIPITGVHDRAKLYELIQDRPLTISISGHTHHHEHLFLTKKQGFLGAQPHHHIINVTVSGSWWSGKSDERGIPHTTMADGAPNGYSIITFDGKNYQLEFKAAGRPSNYQMRIFIDEEISLKKLKEATVFANIFNGSEKSKVQIRLNHGESWANMEKTTGPDPSFVKMFEEDSQIKERKNPKLSAPKNCPHLWKFALPETLTPGTHLVTIKTTDLHGNVHTGQKVFRVTK